LYSLHDLNDLYNFYADLDSEYDGFVETRLALRDEIVKRGHDDLRNEAINRIV